MFEKINTTEILGHAKDIGGGVLRVLYFGISLPFLAKFGDDVLWLITDRQQARAAASHNLAHEMAKSQSMHRKPELITAAKILVETDHKENLEKLGLKDLHDIVTDSA